MVISSRTPEGTPGSCPVCGKTVRVELSWPAGDAPCSHCGKLLWFPQGIIGTDRELPAYDTVVDLRASTKCTAICELVAHLIMRQLLSEQHGEEIVEAILNREALGSTGIGRGYAVPHARHSSLKQFVLAKGIASQGVDFDSLDGEPVKQIFLLLSPVEQLGDHLRALERLSRYIRLQPA